MELKMIIEDLKKLREDIYQFQESDISSEVNIYKKLGELKETEALLAEVIILVHSGMKADKQLFNKRLIRHSEGMIDAALALAHQTIILRDKKKGFWTERNIKIGISTLIGSILMVWFMYLYAPVKTDTMFGRVIELFGKKSK